MTTIAVRAGIMACDSAISETSGDLISLQSKIVRTKHGVLIGGAGDCSDRDLMKVLETVRQPNDFPSLKDLANTLSPHSDIGLLLYFPDRQIWRLEIEKDAPLELWRIEAPFAAIGSGAPCAMTAMDLECSAIRAVEMACKRDSKCKPPVHHLALGKERKLSKRRRG